MSKNKAPGGGNAGRSPMQSTMTATTGTQPLSTVLLRAVSLAFATFGLCWVAGWLGLGQLQHLPFWPATGVAFAVGWMYRLPWTATPAIGAAAWVFWQTNSVILAGAATATTIIGPCVAILVLKRINIWKPTNHRLEYAGRWVLVATLVASVINAVIASTAITATAIIPAANPLHVLLSWWLLDALGLLLIAPCVLALDRSGFSFTGENDTSGSWLDVGAVTATGLIVLASLLVSEIGRQPYAYSLTFFFVPIAAWAAIRSKAKTLAFTLLVATILIVVGRATQLTSLDVAGPPIIEATLLLFVAIMVAILIQAVASDRRSALERVSQQSRQDLSTGLLNDRGLLAEFDHRLNAAGRPHYGLLGIHITNFDTINDLSGPIAALQLEQSVASVLTRQPGQTAAARLSAGRFALLVNTASLAEVRATARAIYSAFNGQIFRTDHGAVRLQPSVGGLLIDREAQTNSEDCLLSLAEAQAIAGSVRDPQLFVEPLSQSIVDARRAQKSRMEQVREAIREHRFEVHAQPIIDAAVPKGKISYEVLIRLIDRDGSLIRPPQFMALAVQARMTPAMDRGVITRVFSWLADHPWALERTHKCSINLSGLTMSDGLIPAFIREERLKYNIDPSKIVFEITESEAIQSPAAASRLVDELKADGFGIALDDFGVGLATFEYLKRFPIDFLKIDGSFIRNLMTSPIDEEIVMSTIRVARRLNVQTVAEHVQSDEIYQRLKELGVAHFQGEHLGNVVPLRDVFQNIAETEIGDSNLVDAQLPREMSEKPASTRPPV